MREQRSDCTDEAEPMARVQDKAQEVHRSNEPFPSFAEGNMTELCMLAARYGEVLCRFLVSICCNESRGYAFAAWRQ